MSENYYNYDTKIQFLKGVGPSKGKALQDLGVHTARDLLEYFPRRWEFLPDCVPISGIQAGSDVTVVGVIESIDFRRARGREIFEIYLADQTAACRVI